MFTVWNHSNCWSHWNHCFGSNGSPDYRDWTHGDDHTRKDRRRNIYGDKVRGR